MAAVHRNDCIIKLIVFLCIVHKVITQLLVVPSQRESARTVPIAHTKSYHLGPLAV